MPASPRNVKLSTTVAPTPDLQKKSLPGSMADKWRIALLGSGGVGKTALAVQVRCVAMLNFIR
jgi:hypothetical protein